MLNYSNILLIIFTVIFCLGIYGVTKLKVENSFVDYFKKETEIGRIGHYKKSDKCDTLRHIKKGFYNLD